MYSSATIKECIQYYHIFSNTCRIESIPIDSDDIQTMGDVDRNPKDFILFRDGAFESVDKDATKDNTGKRRFVDDIVFPTLEFPSDHAILSARLRRSRDTGTTEM